ncbi:MAG: S1/P1 nuclease [Bacteriovoracaceae bacterium]|jgi:hypothetical protein|nr:S1/P1 nuclease [Bacteriovoracaceae bacterium]
MKTLKSQLFIFGLIASCAANAWGPTGHRTVGKIAETYLSKRVLRKVRKLLDGESLARVSNWPDKIKSDPDQYRYTYSWHYTSWPVGQNQYDPTTAEGSLITAISDNIEILKNKKKSKAERAFALKFIVHLMGDLHQPLHIGNGVDRGGNTCKVYFHRKLINLHRLWDSELIGFTKLSYTELTKFIIDIHGKNATLAKNGNVLDWATESKNLREIVYPKEIILGDNSQKSLNKNSSSMKYCQKDIDVPDEELPKLSYKYSFIFMPIVEERIFKAGVRLAKIIKESL